MIRTFIAIEMAEEVLLRAGDLANQLREADAKVKWVDPQNIHLTLKFLGDVPDSDIAAVCDAVAAGAAPLAPFEIECGGAGAFPRTQRPRTVWMGVKRGDEQLVALHDAIDLALVDLGYKRDHRRFKPHLTLGRVRQGGYGQRALGELIDENRDFRGAPSLVEEVLVFASFLDKDGPRHQVLGRAPLEG